MGDSDTAGRIRLLTPETLALLANIITHITPLGWTKAGRYGPGSLLLHQKTGPLCRDFLLAVGVLSVSAARF